MRLTIRDLTSLLIAGALALLGLAGAAGPAAASTNQIAVFQDDPALTGDPYGTMALLKRLGVGMVRVAVTWDKVTAGSLTPPYTPPADFHASDPFSPDYSWTALDSIVQAAGASGIAVDLSVSGGAPLWATGPNPPPGARYPEWEPSARQYGQFVQAIGRRYSGQFRPTASGPALPRVAFWEIWNEPNFGPDLAPQAVNGSRVPTSPAMYRQLVDAGWSALGRTGHGHDMIVLGNLDARGLSGPPTHANPDGSPGTFGATKPIAFIRDLYCVDRHLNPLRGAAARAQGCPTGAAGSKRFRAAHPALFAAGGFGDHPYPLTEPPIRVDAADPDQAEFSQLPHFVSVLDRLQSVYGSRHRFIIYNNEFGYITNPPNRSQQFPAPAVAAAWMNWAEYLSWRQPRITSYDQYLLMDPNPLYAPEYGGFASGLAFYGGALKPSYDAYRLPIFLPAPNVRQGQKVLVWGCARPARAFGNPRVQIQFQAHARGAFQNIAAVTVHNPRGYFEIGVSIRVSGAVRLAWSYPAGPTIYSRTAPLSVR